MHKSDLLPLSSIHVFLLSKFFLRQQPKSVYAILKFKPGKKMAMIEIDKKTEQQ